MAPEILIEILPIKESNYNLRNSSTLQGRSIVSYIIQKEIREWTLSNCPCRLCKNVRIKHWIFVSNPYARLCFVMCDIYVIHIKESFFQGNIC